MQSVSAAFTAEEKDKNRKIAEGLLVSWKRDTNLSSRTFTIGVSLIGGDDLIGLNPGAVGSPGIYKYYDESQYLLNLAWERSLNMPIGGLSKAMAEADLDNTSGRFTPRYIGGQSEIATAMQSRKPVIINAGFNYGGIDNMIPQFAGVISDQPEVSLKERRVHLKISDYVDFFHNRFLDDQIMATGQRTDEIMETLFEQMGLATSQYELDTGILPIPFVLFPPGTRFADIFHQLAEAENGYVYQDEEGVFRFENRHHWSNSPHDTVSKLVLTGQVIEAQAPSDDHIINAVEIRSKTLEKQQEQIIFRLNPFDSVELPGNTTTTLWVEFENPTLSLVAPTATGTKSYYKVFVNEDSSGLDLTANVTVSKITRFAKAAKVELTNSSAIGGHLTVLVISGRTVRPVNDIYTRAVDSSSLTAFDERVLKIENPYIQNQDWANSYAQMILNDFAEPENLQTLIIRAIPELQMGDLISWQGRYWRLYRIKTRLHPSMGFIQELTVLQRDIVNYFRVGISTIGGSDKIAP